MVAIASNSRNLCLFRGIAMCAEREVSFEIRALFHVARDVSVVYRDTCSVDLIFA